MVLDTEEFHLPNAADVYFDETTRDIVIDGHPRGSRGAGPCAITYSAFVIRLSDYGRSRDMPHLGFVILDSPRLAYKEPKGEDDGIAGTDLKLRFYEHLQRFSGRQQIFVIDNTDPPRRSKTLPHSSPATQLFRVSASLHCSEAADLISILGTARWVG